MHMEQVSLFTLTAEIASYTRVWIFLRPVFEFYIINIPFDYIRCPSSYHSMHSLFESITQCIREQRPI